MDDDGQATEGPGIRTGLHQLALGAPVPATRHEQHRAEEVVGRGVGGRGNGDQAEEAFWCEDPRLALLPGRGGLGVAAEEPRGAQGGAAFARGAGVAVAAAEAVDFALPGHLGVGDGLGGGTHGHAHVLEGGVQGPGLWAAGLQDGAHVGGTAAGLLGVIIVEVARGTDPRPGAEAAAGALHIAVVDDVLVRGGEGFDVRAEPLGLPQVATGLAALGDARVVAAARQRSHDEGAVGTIRHVPVVVPGGGRGPLGDAAGFHGQRVVPAHAHDLLAYLGQAGDLAQAQEAAHSGDVVAEALVLLGDVVGGAIGEDAVGDEGRAGLGDVRQFRRAEQAVGHGQGQDAPHVHVDDAVLLGPVGEERAPLLVHEGRVGLDARIHACPQARGEDVRTHGAEHQPGVSQVVGAAEVAQDLAAGHEVFRAAGDAAEDGHHQASIAGAGALVVAEGLDEEVQFIGPGGEHPAFGAADVAAGGTFEEGAIGLDQLVDAGDGLLQHRVAVHHGQGRQKVRVIAGGGGGQGLGREGREVRAIAGRHVRLVGGFGGGGVLGQPGQQGGVGRGGGLIGGVQGEGAR